METQEKCHSLSAVEMFWRFVCMLPQDKVFKVLKPDWKDRQFFREMKDIMME